jgi:hypothetical protein
MYLKLYLLASDSALVSRIECRHLKLYLDDLGSIQSVRGGKVNILGGHNIGHSKQKKCICTCVLFRAVSEIELFHCTLYRRANAMSSHELQSELMLTMEFSQIYYTN